MREYSVGEFGAIDTHNLSQTLADGIHFIAYPVV